MSEVVTATDLTQEEQVLSVREEGDVIKRSEATQPKSKAQNKMLDSKQPTRKQPDY